MMTDEERRQMNHIDETLKSILTEIKGTPSGMGGILPRLNSIETSITIMRKDLAETSSWQKKIRSIIVWIFVGVAIGALIFGYLSARDVVELLKAIK